MEHAGHVCLVFARDEVLDGRHDGTEAKASDKQEDVQMLRHVVFQQGGEGVQTDQCVAGNVRVVVQIVGVDMMLDNMLVDPVHGTSTDPVLCQTQETVYEGIA